MAEITLERYIEGASEGRRAGLADVEIARRLGINQDELKACEGQVIDELTGLVINEGFRLDSAAEILGYDIRRLREYAKYYPIPLYPGFDIALLEIEVKMPQERDSDEMKCLERQKARKAKRERAERIERAREKARKEEERLMAWRQRRKEIKENIEDCKRNGIRARGAIARELGVSWNVVYYLSKGDRKIVGRAEYNAEIIKDAIRKGAKYKDEVVKITGLCEQSVRALDKRFGLGVKRKKSHQDYVSYLTDENERHKRKPWTIRRDYLIGCGLKLREISKTERASHQAIQQYIKKTAQHKIWQDARECRDIIEDGGLIGFIRLED